MTPQTNTMLIALMATVTVLVLYFIFKKDPSIEEEDVELNPYSISFLGTSIRTLFNEIINQNIAELCLNKSETKKRERQKARLNQAIRSCAQGNIGEREFVKDYIKDLLQNNLNINEQTIDYIIPFHQKELLTSLDKFEILMQIFKRDHGFYAFEELSELCGFEKEKVNEYGVYYEVNEEDINNAFEQYMKPLSYVDKIDIVTQRIFETTYGFSVVDELIYQVVDGVSGGCSGITTEYYNYMEEIMQKEDITNLKSYNSVWVFLHGKPIHLSFLGFGSKPELIRVCKNLYQYDNIGHLTSSNGFKHTYLQDRSRVVVTRPNLTSGWAFFVRKYSSSRNMKMEDLIKGKNNTIVVQLSKWLVKGLLNIIISGDQNSGKTTFLKSLLQYLDQRYPLRTTEQEFEMWINNLYTHLNTVAFRGIETVSVIEAINIQKKTDGAIMILGEVSDAELANAYISLTQAGTKSTICTCHTKTEELINYFRNSILTHGRFTNEMKAEEQAAKAIDIDIHWVKTSDGRRHISNITEIIPLDEEIEWPEKLSESILVALKALLRRKTYTTREIIKYENGEYVVKNALSDKTVNKIIRDMPEDDVKSFLAFNDELRKMVNEVG